jgi:hypothetical protein
VRYIYSHSWNFLKENLQKCSMHELRTFWTTFSQIISEPSLVYWNKINFFPFSNEINGKMKSIGFWRGLCLQLNYKISKSGSKSSQFMHWTFLESFFPEIPRMRIYFSLTLKFQLLFKLFSVKFQLFIDFEKIQFAEFMFDSNFAGVRRITQNNFLCILV